MAVPRFDRDGDDLGIIGHFLAGGEMLAAQLPSASTWSPEKKLAAAVLANALVEVRERHGDPRYRRKVAEDLQWIHSDDTEWPFAFVPLCQLLSLEPGYVRKIVHAWTEAPRVGAPRQSSLHRHAA